MGNNPPKKEISPLGDISENKNDINKINNINDNNNNTLEKGLNNDPVKIEQMKHKLNSNSSNRSNNNNNINELRK
jgi:hypothetical protein